ncbi:MAG: efflux RND transporter periplasmic adaptor subunit [Chloroflexi bacterium]|nr:efflux RND transporter periplasmic adaptor subunit [Chloroflexota bacterium]
MLRQPFKWIYGAAALAVGSALLLAACQGQAAPAATSRTATIAVGTIEVRVSATGQIAAQSYSALDFNSRGAVSAVLHQVGDRVKAGDVLIELDPATMDASVVQAQADLIDAKKSLKDLTDPPTELELAQAGQAVQDAAKAVDDAQRHLDGVKYPKVSDYQKALDDALIAFQNAQSQQTITSLGNETGAVDGAQAAVDQAAKRLGEVKTAQAACNNCDPDALKRAQDDYNGAVNGLNIAQLNLEMSQTSHEQAIRDAQDAADKAQRNLNAAVNGPKTSDVARAEAELATAKAKYNKAVDDLADLKAGPKPEDVQAAEARVAAAQARVDQAVVKAPFAGTVVAVNYAPGDTISPGAVAAIVADLSHLHIDTTVDELDIAQVALAQPVAITLDALPGVGLSGKIGSIDIAPDRTKTTIEYPVRIDLDTTDQPVRIGMTAALEILVARKENALLVPNWALRIDREKGGTYVTVQRGGGGVEVPVKLGLRNDSVSEALSGLSAGDVIGVLVTPEPRSGPFGGGG